MPVGWQNPVRAALADVLVRFDVAPTRHGETSAMLGGWSFAPHGADAAACGETGIDGGGDNEWADAEGDGGSGFVEVFEFAWSMLIIGKVNSSGGTPRAEVRALSGCSGPTVVPVVKV